MCTPAHGEGTAAQNEATPVPQDEHRYTLEIQYFVMSDGASGVKQYGLITSPNLQLAQINHATGLTHHHMSLLTFCQPDMHRSRHQLDLC
jgi:hypothetical protein